MTLPLLSSVHGAIIILEYGEHHGGTQLAPQGASGPIKWPHSASLLCDPAELSMDLMAARTQQPVPIQILHAKQMAEGIVGRSINWLSTNINSF